MFDLSELRVPIVQAPMAGGPATVALASAVCRAGGLGFLAAGYKTAEAVTDQISELREHTRAPFGVNLFVPQPAPDPAAISAYRTELAAEAARYGVELPEPDAGDDDRWDDKIGMLLDRPVPVVSFTFGVPSEHVIADLHRVGTCVIATVTKPDEARTAATRGADVLCVQGPEAGGHSGIHDPEADPSSTPLLQLLPAIRDVTSLPLTAAGGLATGSDIAAALRAGARAVQLGTAYLRTPESGAKPVHKEALVNPRFATTVMTRAFSGRPARGLRNRFIDDHGETAPAGYPLVNQLTQPLRAAAAAAGDPEGLHLWAGTGHQHSADIPAAELTARLWEEARSALPDEPALGPGTAEGD